MRMHQLKMVLKVPVAVAAAVIAEVDQKRMRYLMDQLEVQLKQVYQKRRPSRLID